MSDPNPYAPLPGGVPAPTDYPTSSRRHARVVAILAGVAACSAGAQVLLSAWLSWLATQVMAGADVSDQVSVYTALNSGATVATTFSELALSIALIVWTWRANRVARGLGAVDLVYTPSSVVWGYIIPGISLWRPFQAVSEIWRASDPDLARGAPTATGSSWHMILVWWTARIGSAVLGFTLVNPPTTWEGILADTGNWIGVGLVEVAANGLTGLVAWRTAQRQDARAARLGE